MTSSKLRELAGDLEFPEGPIVLADGSVLVVEIKGQRITRVAPDGTKTMVAHCSGGPNGQAIGPDGHVYICNNGGGMAFGETNGITHPTGSAPDYSGGRIERLDLQKGTISEVFRAVEGNPLLQPNDIVFDRFGGFYFTDIGRRQAGGLIFGALYYSKCDGSGARKVVGDLISPNGVGLSPDETRVYVAETQTGRLKVFNIVEPGLVAAISPLEPGKALHAQIEGFKRYDSLAVEGNGSICVGNLTPGSITVISASGKLVEDVALPDPFPTNIAFGGEDMRKAYITLSGSGRLVEMDWPRPGLRLNFQQ